MKILVIEDGSIKLNNLLSEVLDIHFPKYDIAASINAAKKKLRETVYDICIIDMNLPVFSIESGGIGRIEQDGGLKLMRYIHHTKLQTKCILFTQYDSLIIGDSERTLKDVDEILLESYPSLYMGYVYYNTESGNWQNELLTVLQGNHANSDS